MAARGLLCPFSTNALLAQGLWAAPAAVMDLNLMGRGHKDTFISDRRRHRIRNGPGQRAVGNSTGSLRPTVRGWGVVVGEDKGRAGGWGWGCGRHRFYSQCTKKSPKTGRVCCRLGRQLTCRHGHNPQAESAYITHASSPQPEPLLVVPNTNTLDSHTTALLLILSSSARFHWQTDTPV